MISKTFLFCFWILIPALMRHSTKSFALPSITGGSLPVNSIRIFNAYGPRVRTTGAYGAMFGVFLAQKLNKLPLTIVGDGSQTRDFIHVNDLVDAVVKAAEHPIKNEIFNVASGVETSVNTIADIIGGKKISIPKRPGEPDRSLADISKIKKLIGWKPRISINEGVKMLLKDIEQWKNAPIWTPETIENATRPWFQYLKK